MHRSATLAGVKGRAETHTHWVVWSRARIGPGFVTVHVMEGHVLRLTSSGLCPLVDDVIDPPEMLRAIAPVHRAVRMGLLPFEFLGLSLQDGEIPILQHDEKIPMIPATEGK